MSVLEKTEEDDNAKRSCQMISSVMTESQR